MTSRPALYTSGVEKLTRLARIPIPNLNLVVMPSLDLAAPSPSLIILGRGLISLGNLDASTLLARCKMSDNG